MLSCQRERKRQREDDSLGGSRSWKDRLEQRWSRRECIGIEDGESWLEEQPPRKQSKHSIQQCAPPDSRSDGVVHGHEKYCLAPGLAALLRADWMSRPEAARRLSALCKEGGMLNPLDSGEIIFSRPLAKLFRHQRARVGELLGLLTPHLLSPGKSTQKQPSLVEQAPKAELSRVEQAPNTELPMVEVVPRVRQRRWNAKVNFARRCTSGKDVDSLEEDGDLLERGGEVIHSGSCTDQAEQRQRLTPSGCSLVSFKTKLRSRTPQVARPAKKSRHQGLLGGATPSVWPSVGRQATNAKTVKQERVLVRSIKQEPEEGAQAKHECTAETPQATAGAIVPTPRTSAGATVPVPMLQSAVLDMFWPSRLSCLADPEECARRLLPQLAQMGSTSVIVRLRCLPAEAELHFQVLAEPILLPGRGSVGGSSGSASLPRQQQQQQQHGALLSSPHLCRREPLRMRLREAASGCLEAQGELCLTGLTPDLAYLLAVEVVGGGGRHHGGRLGGGTARPQATAVVAARTAEVMLPQRACPMEWTPQEALQWCLSVKVPELARRVEEYSIDGATLLGLGEEDVRALGVTAPFLLRRVLKALRALSEGGMGESASLPSAATAATASTH